MADRAISDLTEVVLDQQTQRYITMADLFAISQSGQAKKLSGSQLIHDLAAELDGHGGISNISYTPPSSGSLNGTLTITLADGTPAGPYTITNGKGITSISGPSTSGLNDTYTINYNDGTSITFTVTNGKGIDSFEKTTAGLVDTYTITYNDSPTDTDQIVVTNGRAISSVTTYYAVSDSNSTAPSTWYTTLQTMTPVNKYLWSYQTITFNDSTTIDTTKAVVGVYGDTGATGQAWYVHIKYSEEQPTADSDMKDSADAWIGIYSGTSQSAPTTYTSYEWYEYKGETGDTGAAASLVTQSVSYQWGSSGTEAPSGTWSSSVPTRTSGDTFLWTKVDLEFNSGSPMTFYSVAHYGVDGTGAVNTVNSISPDGNGNVTITADDINTDDNSSVQDHLDTAEEDIVDLETIVGDGTLSDFTATNLTGAANELNSGKVAKAGDTMTGDLTLNHVSEYIKSTNITDGATVSSNTYGKGYYLSDTNGKNITSIRPFIGGTGAMAGIQGTQIASVRTVNNATVEHYFRLGINASGGRKVLVSDATAWLEALGLKDIGALSNSAGLTRTLTFSGLFKGVLITTAATGAANAMYIIHCTGAANTAVATAVLTASHISVSTAIAKITVTSSDSNAVEAYLLCLKNPSNVTIS